MTGVSKKTVTRLLVECGEFCAAYQDAAFRDLKCQRVQVDEMWSFCYGKQKQLTKEISAERVAGDLLPLPLRCRMTNAFSKKIENHCAAVALGYFAYNFIKINRTLRVTPAMAAQVTTRLWSVYDLVVAWEPWEREQPKRAA
jgi:hypothetical protein